MGRKCYESRFGFLRIIGGANRGEKSSKKEGLRLIRPRLSPPGLGKSHSMREESEAFRAPLDLVFAGESVFWGKGSPHFAWSYHRGQQKRENEKIGGGSLY